MKRTILTTVIFLLPALSSQAQIFQVIAPNGNTALLYGSHHKGDPFNGSERESLSMAVAASRLVVLESDNGQPIGPSLSQLPPGETLPAKAPDSLKACVGKSLQRIQVERPGSALAQNLQFYRPGLLAILALSRFMELTAPRSGNSHSGSDQEVKLLAKMNWLRTVSLEGFDEQREFVEGIDDADAWRILMHICRLESNPSERTDIHDRYQTMLDMAAAGDIDGFTETHRQIYALAGASPVFIEAFWGKRNRSMATKISGMVVKGLKPFVAIGMTHLGGSDGVLNLLRGSGFRVDRACTAARQPDCADVAPANAPLAPKQLDRTETNPFR